MTYNLYLHILLIKIYIIFDRTFFVFLLLILNKLITFYIHCLTTLSSDFSFEETSLAKNLKNVFFFDIP